jgi:hypothetical protein
MVSIKVKVLNKDNQFGGRNIDVSFGSRSFKTPNRTATQKDYNAASSLPHNIVIENPVSEYVSSFNNPSFHAFLTANSSFKGRVQNISHFIDMMGDYPIMSTTHIPTNQRVSQNQLMLFNILQKDDFDIISIPPFNYKNIGEYETTISQFSEAARARGQEAMPILQLSGELETFKLEFASLIKLNSNGICNVIGFTYANPSTHIQQYQEIYERREEDVWYHIFGVPRVPRGKSVPVAHIHELQNYGIDTFSPEVRDVPQKAIARLIMLGRDIKPKEVECPKRFDSQTLGIFKEREWIDRYGHDIHCNCRICNGKDLLSFKEKFMYDLDGSFDPRFLRNADKLHELATGTHEFNDSMEAIKSDDLPAYFNSKELTKGRVKPPIE